MALTAAKVTVTHKLTWTPGSGDSIALSGQEQFVQVGNAAIERTQDFTGITSQLDLGDVLGDKYLFVKNSDTVTYLYIDQANPVVPGAAPFKLAPGKTMMVFTNVDAWFGIVGDVDGNTGGTAQGVVGAVEP